MGSLHSSVFKQCLCCGVMSGVCVCLYRYEDWRALDGGEDGMEVTAKILEMSARYLKKGGYVGAGM